MNRRSVALLAIPFVAAALVYAPYLGNPHLYDDARAVRLMASGTSPSPWPPTFGRALTWAWFGAQHALWGADPLGYRVTSVCLHAASSALAATLAWRLVGSRAAGLAAGLAFALHPVHSEVVASFANNKDSMAFVWIALTLLAWRRATGLDSPNGEDGRRSLDLRWYLASLAAYGLALFSKEVAAIATPVMLVAHDAVFDPRGASTLDRVRTASRRAAPLALVGAAAIAVFSTSAALPGVGNARDALFVESRGAIATRGDALLASLSSVSEQARLLLWPSRLAADYPKVPAEGVWTSPGFGAALWVGSIVGAAWLARRLPWMSFGLLWTAILYLPSSNLAPLIHHFVAERYLYAPSFGICLIAGGAWSATRGGSRLVATAAGTAVLALAATRTVARAEDWSSSERLWSSAIESGYETPRARNALGAWHLEQGAPERAVEEFARSAELLNTVEAQYQLAYAHARAGNTRAARRHLETALAHDPAHANSRLLLEELSDDRNRQ